MRTSVSPLYIERSVSVHFVPIHAGLVVQDGKQVGGERRAGRDRGVSELLRGEAERLLAPREEESECGDDDTDTPAAESEHDLILQVGVDWSRRLEPEASYSIPVAVTPPGASGCHWMTHDTTGK